MNQHDDNTFKNYSPFFNSMWHYSESIQTVKESFPADGNLHEFIFCFKYQLKKLKKNLFKAGAIGELK